MKKYLKLFLTLIILFQISGCASIIRTPKTHQKVLPEEFNRLFQPSELKEDINFLFQTLEAVHPKLYVYTPDSVIAHERNKIEYEINSPLSRVDFYIKIAPLISRLNEGHTAIYPPFEEYKYHADNGGLRFPFDLDFKDGKSFIAANYSADSLISVGCELLSINDIPISNIFDRLIKFVSGKNAAFKTNDLERRFRLLLWFVYKLEQPYEVEFISQSTGERRTLKVPGVTSETIKTKRGQVQKKEKPVYYSYSSLPDEKIGIIDFRSFSNLKQFKTFLTGTFTKIRQDSIKNLIIDIRKNGGGNSGLGNALLNHITGKPFTQCSRMEIKVSKQIKKFYKRCLPWYIRWLPLQYVNSFGRKVWGTPEDSIAVYNSEPETPGENPLRFNGNVYVLTSALTFSSATMFAGTIKDYNLGTLVGEETGGLVTHYGDVYSFDLPNTRISVGVSHKRFVRPSGEDDGKGVLPNYEVKQKLEDSVSGIDTAMEFTKQLIKSNSEKSWN